MGIVYDRDVQITMAGIVESEELPCTVNSLEIYDDEGRLEIRSGPKGPQGPQGDPSYGFIFMGRVEDLTELNAITVTHADKGKAWWVADINELRLWDGRIWIPFTDAFQGTGHQGPPNVLTGVAEVGATGSSALATLTGDSPNQVLTITVPKGATGPDGDPGVAGRIQDASDVDTSTVALSDHMVLQWDATLSKFVPAPSPTWRGPWTIGGSRFAAASNSADAPRTIASMTVPAQPFAWRPYVIGRVPMQIHVQAVGDSRIDIEVRSGAEDGPIVAYGRGFSSANYIWTRLIPKFESTLSPATTSVATVAAGQTQTFYVRAIRAFGTANYSTVSDIAFLTVYAMPLFQ
ncbi:hypothetical protein [Nocardia abscessus]|uniref:hypothetical protein n=1 Tax=Nocardia abscessus TaxID=120957 RepID=UPI0002F33998|nr:hypothetical protein [Nocardia abscessus]MCC3333601.1 hypothetical protein [Nocardia abscessus]